ncbi:hypothetical protein [uncultured Tateyamaria sp.]|uniref:hypothetical protein n=1 Tax=uncultured Tateyamaria sp. TaxID=455651 RepID=UPI0026144B87|nr:hypothetical protein [uncultured Tateyamaria sp.]
MDTRAPTFVVTQLNMTDMTRHQAEYADPLNAINDRHGVETAIATLIKPAKEGKVAANLIAVLHSP